MFKLTLIVHLCFILVGSVVRSVCHMSLEFSIYLVIVVMILLVAAAAVTATEALPPLQEHIFRVTELQQARKQAA